MMPGHELVAVVVALASGALASGALAAGALVGCQAIIDVEGYAFGAAGGSAGADATGAAGASSESAAAAGAGDGSLPPGADPMGTSAASNACSDSGARECAAGGVRVCESGAWGAPFPCEPPLVCSNGVCAPMRVTGGLVSTLPASSAAPVRLMRHGFEASERTCSGAEGSAWCVRGGVAP